MCGIFGYIGKKNAVNLAIAGLKKLEYRGYDSAGIAGISSSGSLQFSKSAGKVAALQAQVEEEDLELNTVIAHTRWATHGPPTEINAHPQLDESGDLALVHNGIIENYDGLKTALQERGITFISDTDTEVVAQLIGSLYEGNLLEAVQQALPMLEGSFALAVVHKNHPKEIVVAANESPLAIGMKNDEAFIASDAHAFFSHTCEVVFLGDGEVARVTPSSLHVYDKSAMEVRKETEFLEGHAHDVSKGDYEHFTLKEIHEQPQTLKNALLARYLEDYGTVCFEELGFTYEEMLGVERILILACGTSYHAGYLASYMIEEKARIPVQVEISSEFRYKNPVVPENSIVIAISQSGETADTLAAVRELKAKGARVLALCNVHGSSIVREADGCILLRAGAEIGVCSTKAFTSQVAVLSLFGLQLARQRHMSKKEGQEFIEALKQLPAQVDQVLRNEDHIRSLAAKYAGYENFFFVGRNYMYPAALEGALKLKEISYINANGYPAGELKHGPIALIHPDCPTIALCANKLTYGKVLSNLMEIKARKGPILAIAEEGCDDVLDVADDVIWVPRTLDELAAIPTSVVTQLLAYYIALERGAEIDQPRNLAKSVTVE